MAYLEEVLPPCLPRDIHSIARPLSRWSKLKLNPEEGNELEDIRPLVLRPVHSHL